MDWYSILLNYGVDVQETEQFNILCPFHEDSVPSCSINTEKGVWICFAGCGQGSLRGFIHKISGVPLSKIDEDLQSKSLEINFEIDKDFETYYEEIFVQHPTDLFELHKSHWIYDRGFTEETLNKWECQQNNINDLVIPVKGTSNIEGWITRRFKKIPKYLFSKGFKKSRFLFGQTHITNPEVLYVVEGALDAMWLDQHGYNAVAILGAVVSNTQIDMLSFLNPSQVVLCLDNDEAGRKGIEKGITGMRNRFMLSFVDLKQYKDVQEIRDREELTEIINNTSYW